MFLVPTLPLGGRPTWSYVQGASSQDIVTVNITTRTVTKAFTNPVRSGDIVLVGILFGSTNGSATAVPLITVTDDKGNAYNLVATGLPGSTAIPYGYATFISAAPITNGPTTLTCTINLPYDTLWMLQDEFRYNSNSNLISIDGRQGFYGNTPTADVPGFVTRQSYSLNWAVGLSQGDIGVPGTGWTAGQGNGTQMCSQWRNGSVQAGTTVDIDFSSVPAAGNFFCVGGVSVSPTAQDSWWLRQSQIFHPALAPLGLVSFTDVTAPGSVVVGLLSSPDNLISNIAIFNTDNGDPIELVSPGTNDSMMWTGGIAAAGMKGVQVIYNNGNVGDIGMTLHEFVPPAGTVRVLLDSSSNANTGTSANLIAGPVATTGFPDLIYTYVNQTGAATQVAPLCGLMGLGSRFSDGFYTTDSIGDAQAGWTTTGTMTSIGIMALRAYPY